MAYTWEGMIKIKLDQAFDLVKKGDKEVYILYEDNTESLIRDISVFDEDWIDQVEFGIEKRGCFNEKNTTY